MVASSLSKRVLPDDSPKAKRSGMSGVGDQERDRSADGSEVKTDRVFWYGLGVDLVGLEKE